MSEERFDAIVIGAGAAGLTAAAELSAAHWKVLVLEEGPWYNPFRDYLDGAVKRLPVGLSWTEDCEVRPSMTKAVGGSTVFYMGVFFRLHESDFRTRSRAGVGVDWPLDYRELEPYYDYVEKVTGASGSPENVFEAPRGPYPNPAHRISGSAWKFRQGALKLGLHPAVSPSSILSRPYNGRPGCTYCGRCGEGCMVGDKSSAEMTWAPLAVAAGADIRPGCKVFSIRTDNLGKATGVVYKGADGVERAAAAEVVLLCAGAVHDPIILARSRGPAHPEGLGAAGGMRGRNLMQHVGGRYITAFDEPVHGYMGLSGGVNVQDHYEGAPGAGFARGYTLYVSLQVFPPSTFADWYLEDSWGEQLTRRMASYDRMIRVAVLGEDQASPENRIEEDPEKKDADGLPLARARYVKSANETAIHEHAFATCREVCCAAGAESWEIASTDNTSAHPLGTCRMGDDPASSVVDRWGRCHDTPGLYLCDSSVFPTAGAVNPACTVMALAARTVAHLIGRRPG
ncbi:GMC family oxidoreductase [bacterium]|nr:GMC family oxidoreductase [bacterium]